MKYLINAFSVAMLPTGTSPLVVKIGSMEAIAEIASMIFEPGGSYVKNPIGGGAKGIDGIYAADSVSAIGHADTAAILSGITGIKIPVNRISIQLSFHNSCILAQYCGPRLPEGTTMLPDGAEIQFYRISLIMNEQIIGSIKGMSDVRDAWYNVCNWPDAEKTPDEKFVDILIKKGVIETPEFE